MKRIIIPALLIAFAVQANAAQQPDPIAEWVLNPHNLPVAVSVDNTMYVIYSERAFWFISTEKTCTQTDAWTEIKTVDGQTVNGTSLCIDSKENWTPESVAGKRFVLNKFKTKNVVTFEGYEFTAKGFSAAIKAEKKAIKDAI